MIMNIKRSFPILSRLLHWLMAALILAMLVIGVRMMVSPDHYAQLVSLHKPIGVAILVLVVIRIINRIWNRPPPLPSAMPIWQKRVALASHILLYGLMISMPLIGWAMLSAGNYPIEVSTSFRLPALLPANPALHSQLRQLHTVLAFVLFGTLLLHIAAALMHALVFRDGVFRSMATLKR